VVPENHDHGSTAAKQIQAGKDIGDLFLQFGLSDDVANLSFILRHALVISNSS